MDEDRKISLTIPVLSDINWHRVCKDDGGGLVVAFSINKNPLYLFLPLFIFILIMHFKPTQIQGKQQEEVTVIAVEVPVRILQKGQFVKGLTKKDLELYQSIIKRIKSVEGEKWAICFQQREMFPKLKNESSLERLIRDRVETPTSNPTVTIQQRNIRSMQMQMQRTFAALGELPTEALKSLFMEANITFHLILLKSQKQMVEKDFELREVGQDYEDCFRQISFSTGGHTVFSNKVVEAMEEASQAEDYYYLLVYSPKEDQSDKQLNIDVKVNRKGVRVIHLKKFSKEKISPVSITSFNAKQGTINFSVVNYQRVKMEGQLMGIAQVKISLFDENSKKVYDESNTLRLIKEETHISIPFQQLKSGNYFIIIQVIDRMTNHVDVFSKQIKLKLFY